MSCTHVPGARKSPNCCTTCGGAFLARARTAVGRCRRPRGSRPTGCRPAWMAVTRSKRCATALPAGLAAPAGSGSLPIRHDSSADHQGPAACPSAGSDQHRPNRRGPRPSPWHCGEPAPLFRAHRQTPSCRSCRCIGRAGQASQGRFTSDGFQATTIAGHALARLVGSGRLGDEAPRHRANCCGSKYVEIARAYEFLPDLRENSCAARVSLYLPYVQSRTGMSESRMRRSRS
jgi:hypothetical protein